MQNLEHTDKLLTICDNGLSDSNVMVNQFFPALIN